MFDQGRRNISVYSRKVLVLSTASDNACMGVINNAGAGDGGVPIVSGDPDNPPNAAKDVINDGDGGTGGASDPGNTGDAGAPGNPVASDIKTEDMILAMIIADKRTLWHIVIVVATLSLAIMSRSKCEENGVWQHRTRIGAE